MAQLVNPWAEPHEVILQGGKAPGGQALGIRLVAGRGGLQGGKRGGVAGSAACVSGPAAAGFAGGMHADCTVQEVEFDAPDHCMKAGSSAV